VLRLVDTHCHLYFDSFDADRSEVIQRARQNGVERILNIGIDIPSSKAAIQLAQSATEIFAAIGIHPNESDRWDESSYAELLSMSKSAKVVAIGEIGLDYYRKYTLPDLQKSVFQEQLALAKSCGLPVVIHTRNASDEDQSATEDALQLLVEWQKDLAFTNPPLSEYPGVLHSFSGSLSHAILAIDHHFMIGITGPITFEKAEGLRNVVKNIPLESILIETDAPFLTPHPYRGKRNEPAYVRFVAEKIAEVKQKSLDSALEITGSNAEKLFHW